MLSIQHMQMHEACRVSRHFPVMLLNHSLCIGTSRHDGPWPACPNTLHPLIFWTRLAAAPLTDVS